MDKNLCSFTFLWMSSDKFIYIILFFLISRLLQLQSSGFYHFNTISQDFLSLLNIDICKKTPSLIISELCENETWNKLLYTFANTWTHNIADLSQEREKNLTRVNAGISGPFRDKGPHCISKGRAEAACVFPGVISMPSWLSHKVTT